MDVGASTGGFTDCMLQNGAAKVYSVDVGYGQLAWNLRTDERVINLWNGRMPDISHRTRCRTPSVFVLWMSLLSLLL